MTEPRFHPLSQPLDLDRLLALTGARLARPVDRPLAITGVSSLAWAGPSDLACLEAGDDVEALGLSGAGALLLDEAGAAHAPSRAAALVSDQPAIAFAQVVRALYPDAARPPAMFGPGVAAGAVVHPEARLEPDVAVAPGAVVGARAAIGGGAVIGANAVIGSGVHVGRDSMIGDGAVIQNALIGDRVTIHAGAAVGLSGGAAHPAPAVGRVVVQDGVEIGANAAIARGRREDTIIGEGARIDALVRIGADARIGRFCFISAPVASGVALADEEVVVDARSSPPSPRGPVKDHEQ